MIERPTTKGLLHTPTFAQSAGRDGCPHDRTLINDAKKPFCAGKPPTSALIGVATLALPWLIEIEAFAVLDG